MFTVLLHDCVVIKFQSKLEKKIPNKTTQTQPLYILNSFPTFPATNVFNIHLLILSSR